VSDLPELLAAALNAAEDTYGLALPTEQCWAVLDTIKSSPQAVLDWMVEEGVVQLGGYLKDFDHRLPLAENELSIWPEPHPGRTPVYVVKGT